MLSAEAVRLAALEILCPTAALDAGSGFPTLAGHRVYDSREVALQDIDGAETFLPVLSLHTIESGFALRGPMTSVDDTEADAVLDIVAELAVSVSDETGSYADAMAGTDPEARLVLSALCSQVRFLLDRSIAGGLWRRIVKRIIRFEAKTFGVPDLGIHYQRVTMRFHVEIRDDNFDVVAGGLPEPIRSVCDALPEGSYTKAKLLTLAAHFAAEPPTALAGMDFTARIPGGTEINGVVGTPKP